MSIPTGSDAPPFVRLAHHPLRWRLMVELAASDLRVRELVERLDQPQNLVSYHLRLLREGGLVTARRSSYDGRDTYYHLDLDRCADGLALTGAALHPALRRSALPSYPPAAAPLRVLFVCTGNSARSPIAEALLRRHTGRDNLVASAGISPKSRVHPQAIRVMRERFDIDIHNQAPRAIDAVTGLGPDPGFDWVVTLCDKAREHLPERDGWRRTHWSVADPAEAPGPAGDTSFIQTAIDLETRVRHLIPTLDTRRQAL